jgi:hypothetical protein
MKVTLVIAALLGMTEGVTLSKRHSRGHYASFNNEHSLVQKRSYPGVTLLQTEAESDPIHGSLGATIRTPYKPTEEQVLESHMQTLKPRTYTAEKETVDVTAKSIKIAEKITGVKMEEPFDI